MSVIIDLSNFNDLGLNGAPDSVNLPITRISPTTLRIESKTGGTQNILYRVPGPLPVGAKVTLICETKAVSGALVQLAIYSSDDDTYDTNKVLMATTDGDPSGEFIESRMVHYVSPGRQYIRCTVGWLNGRIGAVDIRGLRVVIDGADINTVKPDQTVPPSYSRYISMSEMAREWTSETAGTGVVTKAADKITMTADLPSRAIMRSIVRLDNLPLSRGLSVDLKCFVRSGFPAIFVNYFNAASAVIWTHRGYFLGMNDTWARFWFPPVQDVAYSAAYAKVDIGVTSLNDADFDLKGVRLTQYGALDSYEANAAQLLCATLQRNSGSWILDNNSSAGPIRPASVRIETLSVTSTALIVGYPSLRGGAPAMSVNIAPNLNYGVTYYALISVDTNSSATVHIYDRATGALVDPNTIPNGMYIYITGIGIK